ncbi:hypothetical protein D3C86_1033660 [compost metagenome]
MFSILSNFFQGVLINISRESMNFAASKYKGGRKFFPEANGKLSITCGLISFSKRLRISI